MPSWPRAISFMPRRQFCYDLGQSLQDGHIRLLTLLPGRDPDTIKCRLHSVNLADKPVYEALSYQWGGQWREHIVLIRSKRFVVRYNLLSALQHLRDATNERVLWVDAICINQDDNIEKSAQIGYMGRIYSQAASVIVWLGKADNHSRMALQFLYQLAEERLDDGAITSLFKAKVDHTSGIRLDLALGNTLSSNNYWYRLWIIQEIVLGTRDIVLCFGNDQISWSTVGIALDRLREYLYTLPLEPRYEDYPGIHYLDYLTIHDLSGAVEYGRAAQLHLIRSARSSPSHTPNALRRLLGMAQRAECYDIHDKIYGLLGMTDFKMPVDYKKEIFEVYIDAMFYFRDALLESLEDPREMYTAKLSQVFQSLLMDPFPKKITSPTVPCIKMIGIISGQILQIESGSSRASPESKTMNPEADIAEDRKDEVTARLRNILHLTEESPGHEIPTLNGRLISELVIRPRKPLALGCVPHHFEATRRPAFGNSNINTPKSVPRAGSVPINDEHSHWDDSIFKLFVASRLEENSSSGTVSIESMRHLIGLTSPDAKVGDLIIRFLESEFCLVLRSMSGEYRFAGCAWIPKSGDPCTDLELSEELRKVDHLLIRGSAPSYSQFRSAVQDPTGLGIDIVIDLEAFQFMTNIRH